MLKKILVVLSITFLIFLFFVGICFWWICIKEKKITDKNFLGWCVSRNQIHIRNQQSATIITKVENSKLNDTLIIDARETTVFNPFKTKNTDTTAYDLPIQLGVKYIKIGDTIRLLTQLPNCRPL